MPVLFSYFTDEKERDLYSLSLLFWKHTCCVLLINGSADYRLRDQ